MAEIWFLPEAAADAEEAARWYRERAQGLGEVFAAVLDAKLAEILAHPSRFPIVHRQIRRALLPRFPYGVFFVEEGEQIVVVACLHAARDPRTWKRKPPGS